MSDNKEIMKNITYYLDSLIITINPDLDVPSPDHHPCQKCLEDLNDDIADYIELINKLQRHTRYGFYCLRIDKKTGEQKCRFGFLKELINQTTIQNDNGRL